jgi:hypothetical protein
MNFIPSKFYDHRYRSGPTARRCVAAIGLSLSILAIAHPVIAKSVARPAALPKAAQTIALKPADEPGKGAIASPTQDFRLLGYGLFLLQIGLIPLKLAKGNVVQTMVFDRRSVIAPD